MRKLLTNNNTSVARSRNNQRVLFYLAVYQSCISLGRCLLWEHQKYNEKYLMTKPALYGRYVLHTLNIPKDLYLLTIDYVICKYCENPQKYPHHDPVTHMRKIFSLKPVCFFPHPSQIARELLFHDNTSSENFMVWRGRGHGTE